MIDRLIQFGDRVVRWVRLQTAEPEVCLRTERLVLREPIDADWEAVFAYQSDRAVLRYMRRTEPYSEVEVYSEVYFLWTHRCVHPRRIYDLVAVLEREQRVIGGISLSRLGPEGSEAVIGFTFAREVWGQGYATEAATEMVRFGFEELGLERIAGGCHPENTGSRRVMEKAGLPYRGTEAEFPGAPEGCLSLVFSVEREAWLAPHPRGVVARSQF